MKIEVTFQRYAKKQFRDQCIKRLQNFVTTIKSNKEDSPLEKQLVVAKYQRDRKYNKDEHFQQVIKNPNQEQSLLKSTALSYLYDADKATKDSFLSTCSKEECEQRKAVLSDRKTQDFSIKQMRQNVNKILQKLQESDTTTVLTAFKMEQTLQSTNTKLDYLIQSFQRYKDVGVQEQRRQAVSLSFQQQFRGLVDRFSKIKYKERWTRRSYQGVKCNEQFGQTFSSMTFSQL